MTLKQQACMTLLHLIHDCRNLKGLLNFVRERIKLIFQTSKTTITPHTSELKSIFKFQLITFHLKTFKNIWFFLLYLETGETELINYEIPEIRALYRSRWPN